MNYARIALIVLAIAVTSPLGCGSNDREASSEAKEALERGWTAFIEGLEEARGEIEDPWLAGPDPSERNLADGYRYLLGHAVRIAETEFGQHADLPYFQRSVRMMSKWTIDNPDTLYLSAPIDPAGTYRIRARAADSQDWHTSKRTRIYPKAPRLVTFQTTTATIGDTGELNEFATCRNQTLGFVQGFEIFPDHDGRFEILVAPSKPDNYRGHFLPTRGSVECAPRDKEPFMLEREATNIAVREIFSNWDTEVPMDLEIERIDTHTNIRPSLNAEETAQRFEAIGAKLPNQIRFWNALHEFGLEVLGDRNLDGKRALPENALNPAAPPFIAGGTAGARQLYSAGTFNLDDDQALILRVETKVDPHYVGFQLANFWGESLDQASYTSSLTGGQLPRQRDGARYYVVTARDPGVPGWLDPTGLPEGAMSMRFVYNEDPAEKDFPVITSTLTTFDQIRKHLPEGTATVSSEKRRTQIARRQAHIRKRWRQY